MKSNHAWSDHELVPRSEPLNPEAVEHKKIEVKPKKEKHKHYFDTTLRDPNDNFVRSGQSQKNVSVWELESEKEDHPSNFDCLPIGPPPPFIEYSY